MIVHGSIELSHHVAGSETRLPLTVDGKVVNLGVAVSTRGSDLRTFARELDRILREGTLNIRIGESFEKAIIMREVGVGLDLPRVTRGEEIRLALTIAKPPACSVVLMFFAEIEEGPVKPDLN
jgi:hypothetical protein